MKDLGEAIRIARNAGWAVREETLPMLANLIIAGYEAGVAEEREACRDIAAQYASCEGIAQRIEQEIRARGEK